MLVSADTGALQKLKLLRKVDAALAQDMGASILEHAFGICVKCSCGDARIASLDERGDLHGE